MAMQLQESMDAARLPQSNVASLPPPQATVPSLPHAAAPARHFEPLFLPEPNAAPAPARELQAAKRGLRRLPPTVGLFLANALRNRWESYRTQLRTCQDDSSEETIHELRVATRRLIAQLVMLRCVTPGTKAERARKILKRRLKALGELRDTHVQRLFVERQMARFPELILVRDSLQQREHRLKRCVAVKVRGFKARKLEKWISSLTEYLARNPKRTRRSERLAGMVARAITEAFAEVVCRREAIRPANPGTIHRTRIAFKKFRYMVESLSPDFTGYGKRELRALAHYQRRMGVLQDLEVMQQCLVRFEQKHQGTGALLRPFARHVQLSRARSLRSFLRAADQLFEFWPAGRASESADIRDAA